MQLHAYRRVLAVPGVRSVLLLGFLVRTPMFAGGLVLTLHVVSTLGRSYGEAGIVAAVFTVAIAISAPWRGRLLDRVGLRRTVLPSVVVEGTCWTIAPFLPYAALVPVAALAGLFMVPTFSILRQALIVAVDADARRTTLSLDSVFTELSFMIGPAVGVWAATTWDTRVVLVVLQLVSVLASVVLMVVNPPMRGATGLVVGPPDDERPPARRSAAAQPVGGGVRAWMTAGVVSVFAAAAASTVVLGGTDVAIVAALRASDAAGAIGWVMAVWGAGSLLGGLFYGAWHRAIPVFWLLGGLAVTTLPVALAPNLPVLAMLLFVCGLLCAPTITATVDTLSRLVPEVFRGEAMGWHGSSMTTGQALGAPLAGFAVDVGGWQWGFVSVSLVGLGVAALGVRLPRKRLSPHQVAPMATPGPEPS